MPERPFRTNSTSLVEGFKQALRSVRKGFQWVDDHREDLRSWGEDVGRRGGPQDPWRWLFNRVDALTSLTMKGGLELERRLEAVRSKHGVTLTLLVDGAVDEQVTESLRSALLRAPLQGQQLEQLQTALDFIDAGSDHLAGPLLINTLEGVLWFEVANRGLIERNQKNKWQQTDLARKPGQVVHGVEEALNLVGADLDDDFRDFVKAVVYGSPGDPFRHGTPIGGWQLRANFLVFALAGWLDLHGLLDSSSVVHAAFRRAAEQPRTDAQDA
jgi:hypothetical protein